MTKPQAGVCSSCGEPRMPHRVCMKCGDYGGKAWEAASRSEVGIYDEVVTCPGEAV